MTYYVVKRGKGRAYRDADGHVFHPDEAAPIIICGDFGPHCACGGITEILCDFPVGDALTCDAKLCDHGSHEIGLNLHYCDAHHARWREYRDGGGLVRESQNVEPLKGR